MGPDNRWQVIPDCKDGTGMKSCRWQHETPSRSWNSIYQWDFMHMPTALPYSLCFQEWAAIPTGILCASQQGLWYLPEDLRIAEVEGRRTAPGFIPQCDAFRF